MSQAVMRSHERQTRHSDQKKQDAKTVPTERELLARWGFTTEEIASLLWLRQWYQTRGSDRAPMVRYLEFLRLLVRSGELEL